MIVSVNGLNLGEYGLNPTLMGRIAPALLSSTYPTGSGTRVLLECSLGYMRLTKDFIPVARFQG